MSVFELLHGYVNVNMILCISTPRARKMCHFVFEYNSGVSGAIFINMSAETGMNTLQLGLLT